MRHCILHTVAMILALAALHMTVQGRERANIVVDAQGRGDFRTIQEALNSVPADNKKNVIILVRNGIYNEKIFIQRSFVTLVGEDRDSTRIVFAELRENWTKDHGSDWGSAVINIDSSVTDLTLANLTMYNNYGSQTGVYAKHQFTIRGDGTRIMLLHCNVISDGADAISLWNRRNGMYYHADCFFEGWVDYVCPRGWCYITDSQFFGHNKSASIWHDGSTDQNQKFVIVNSRFDGVPGFPLGRNHRDGQYFLINCSFSKFMANRPIYYPSESPNAKPWKWGTRQYYFNCHRDEADYSWFADNLDQAEGSPSPSVISAKWTFDSQWDPEASMPSVLPFAYFPSPKNKLRNQDTSVELMWIAGRNATSHRLHFGTSNPPEFKKELKLTSYRQGRLKSQTKYYWRVDEVTDDGVIVGKLWSFETR